MAYENDRLGIISYAIFVLKFPGPYILDNYLRKEDVRHLLILHVCTICSYFY